MSVVTREAEAGGRIVGEFKAYLILQSVSDCTLRPHLRTTNPKDWASKKSQWAEVLVTSQA